MEQCLEWLIRLPLAGGNSSATDCGSVSPLSTLNGMLPLALSNQVGFSRVRPFRNGRNTDARNRKQQIRIEGRRHQRRVGRLSARLSMLDVLEPGQRRKRTCRAALLGGQRKFRAGFARIGVDTEQQEFRGNRAQIGGSVR